MGEFDGLDARKFVDYSDVVRAEKLRKEQANLEQQMHEQAARVQVILAERSANDDRSNQLFQKLKAYEHYKISTGQELTVVMEDIDRVGTQNWALIRVDSQSLTPRHRPAPRATPEWIVAVRCQSKPRYHLGVTRWALCGGSAI